MIGQRSIQEQVSFFRKNGFVIIPRIASKYTFQVKLFQIANILKYSYLQPINYYSKFTSIDSNNNKILIDEKIIDLKENIIFSSHNHQKESLCDLNNEILKYFDSIQSTWRYSLWRYFNTVSTSFNRHSIPLPFTTLIYLCLNDTINHIKPFLSTQLHENSPLVELSSIISLPGSLQQDIHSDISYSDSNSIISVFVALSKVSIESGPTYLFPCSNSLEFHSKCNLVSESNYYSSDGSIESNIDIRSNNKIVDNIIVNTDNNNNKSDISNNPVDINTVESVCALLDIGDVLIFDTQILHYGGANISKVPRVLLSFSFQKRDKTEQALPIEGFTYHCHDSIKGRWNLSDF